MSEAEKIARLEAENVELRARVAGMIDRGDLREIVRQVVSDFWNSPIQAVTVLSDTPTNTIRYGGVTYTIP